MVYRHHRILGLVLAAASGIALASGAKTALADTITGFIFDNAVYEQTSNSVPTTPAFYFFSIGATFQTAGDYSTATAVYPGHSTPLSLPLISSTEFNFDSSRYASLAMLHSDYPFGTYTITTSGSAGTEVSNVPYSADYFASTTPYLTNFSGLAGLNPTAAFTAQYPSFTPNSNVSQGLTFFTIYNASTGAIIFSNGFQPPSSTSTVIPADTLLPDTTYDFELDFSDRLNGMDNVNNTFTTQGFDLRTDGSFTTAPAPLIGRGIPFFLAFGSLLFGAKLLERSKRRPLRETAVPHAAA